MTLHSKRRLWNKIELVVWIGGMALAITSALVWMATSAWSDGTVMFKNQPTPVYYAVEEVEV